MAVQADWVATPRSGVRQFISIPLVLLLVAALHADWHFARSHEHRLSLDWSYHWLFCAAVLAVAARHVARRWPGARWRAGAWNLGLALIGAQLVEPILEAAYYDRRFGYPVEAERWVAFGECVAAGLPAYWLVLWLTRPRTPTAGAV